MKNKEKFKKIADIISKVLLAILIGMVIFVLCFALFKSCNGAIKQHTAYASETDGIGTWVWNEYISVNELFNVTFDFVSGGRSFGYMACGDVFDDGSTNLDYYLGTDYVTAFDALNGVWVDGYNIIDIKTAPPAEFLEILRANAVYQGGGEPEPVTYSLTTNIVNGTIINAPATISSEETLDLQLSVNSGYSYPTKLTVTGCQSFYNNQTGVLTLANATSNVTVNGSAVVVAPPVTYDVNFSIDNATFSGPSTIPENVSRSYVITPNAGYTYPATLSVVGATFTYDNTTGSLILSNPTANVTVSGKAQLSFSGSVQGVYQFQNNYIDTWGGLSTGQSITQNITFSLAFLPSVNYNGIKAVANERYTAIYYIDSAGNEVKVYDDAVTVANSGWVAPEYQVINIQPLQTPSTEFATWLNDFAVRSDSEAIVAYQQGYDKGFSEGSKEGQTNGYTSGYDKGFIAGKEEGYNKGYTDGQHILGGTEGLIAGTSNLFAMKIFGTFSILDILLLVFGIGIGIWFLKMFAGG